MKDEKKKECEEEGCLMPSKQGFAVGLGRVDGFVQEGNEVQQLLGAPRSSCCFSLSFPLCSPAPVLFSLVSNTFPFGT